MEPKMNILFIGKKSRTTRHQLLPIYLSVTIDGKRFELATHQHARPTEWSPLAGKIIGRSEMILQVNMELDLIKKRVYDYRERILIENREFTVNTLRDKWFGEDRNKRTLFGVFGLSILDLEKLVGRGIYKKSTLTKYKSTVI